MVVLERGIWSNLINLEQTNPSENTQKKPNLANGDVKGIPGRRAITVPHGSIIIESP